KSLKKLTLQSSDNGEYECRGYRNDELIGSNRVTLYATNTGPLDAARVEIDPPTVRVLNQGDSIELTCTVEGTPSSQSLDLKELNIEKA
ncbi:unnamed protein product, partial [Gongylonema pulchrum]|uniref:Ig-like domain-containing protein n=1 Tax=Gongylonema pulchrum TaxID=637853 RepID=A0A183CX84_9BILA